MGGWTQQSLLKGSVESDVSSHLCTQYISLKPLDIKNKGLKKKKKRINFDGLCPMYWNQSNVFTGISETNRPVRRAVLSWLSKWLSDISM